MSCDARLGRPAGPFGVEVGLDEAQVAGLEQVDGPDPGIGPHSVVVLRLGADHVPGAVQQPVRAGRVALGEQVGQDADDIMAEFLVVTVGAGLQLVAVADDLGVDEAGLVPVDQARIGQRGDLGDLGQLPVPVRGHMGEVLAEAARGHDGTGGREGVTAAEGVRGHRVVVVDGAVRRHRVRRRVQADEPGRSLGVDADRGAGRVAHLDPAVDDHERVAADGHVIAEVRDRDLRAVPVERRDQRRQVPVGVGPRGRAVVVDAVTVRRAGHRGRAVAARTAVRAAGVDEEAAAQTGHHRLGVARPADHPGVAERAVDRLAAGRAVRCTAVRRCLW